MTLYIIRRVTCVVWRGVSLDVTQSHHHRRQRNGRNFWCPSVCRFNLFRGERGRRDAHARASPPSSLLLIMWMGSQKRVCTLIKFATHTRRSCSSCICCFFFFYTHEIMKPMMCAHALRFMMYICHTIEMMYTCIIMRIAYSNT